MPVVEIIPLVLTAILASIPVALPATFTLASALGARALAKLGVLPTRLSAVDEAASMVVLCSDKTGTLTQNALTVTTVRPMAGFDEAHVLALAALASSDGGEDPVDGAIRAAASSKAISDAPKLVKFAAFDPAKKMSEATATDAAGTQQRIVKGAFCGRHRPRPAIADSGGCRQGTRGQGLPGISRCRWTGGNDEARRTHRAQRSAAQGFGRARHRIARPGRPHRDGDG